MFQKSLILRYIYGCIIFVGGWHASCGQSLPNRYVSPVFSNWTETTNITFSTGVPRPNPGGGFYEFITGYPLNVREYQTTPVNLKMNIFTPQGDTLSKRPVIIIAFGGGFLSGSKDHWSIRLLAQELAKRGFVTAVIDYRLGMNIFDSQLAMRAVYRGLQDGRSAVRFFKADAAGANIYKVDPDNIYLGGHSSGGFIALHNAYLDRDSLRPASTRVWTQNGYQVPDQLTLDSVGDNRSFNGRAKAIFNLAGALGFTEYIEQNNEPILTSFHSTDDETVPYESGEPFSNLLWLVVGSDLPEVYGSHPISIQANTVGLTNELHTYSNRGHGVHENGSNALYDDIVPGISLWFHEHLLRPEPITISGNRVICNASIPQTYSVRADSAAYYDWQISGGSFITQSPLSPQVSVLWHANATQRKLSVTPYSYHRARGIKDSISVNLEVLEDNIWSGFTQNWSDPLNWSLGEVPDICHKVIFPDYEGQALPVELDSSQLVNISGLVIGHNNHLTLSSPLHVHQGSGVINNGQMFIHDTLFISDVHISPQHGYRNTGFSMINTNGVLTVQNPSGYAMRVETGSIQRNDGKINIIPKPGQSTPPKILIQGTFENDGAIHLQSSQLQTIEFEGSGILINSGQLQSSPN